jgi:hypothetical protein
MHFCIHRQAHKFVSDSVNFGEGGLNSSNWSATAPFFANTNWNLKKKT